MSKTKTNPSELIRLRPATETDVAFIFNSWLKNYRHSINTRGCENPVYFAQHHVLLEGLCKQCPVTIACNPDDITQIYGYLCMETVEDLPVVHMVYVKEMYRKLGIAKAMLNAAGVELEKPVLYTHRTLMTEELQKKFAIVFNPYLAYYAYTAGKHA